MLLGRMTILTGAMLSFLARDGHAQARDRGTSVGVAAGMSVVGAANRYNGATGALHVQVAVGRPLRPGLATELVIDLFGMETMTSVPGCAPPLPGEAPVYCGERTERAGALLGCSIQLRWSPARRGLGFTASVGLSHAPSVRGPVASTGAALSSGVEYEFGGSTGVRPVIGVRGMRLTSDPGGIRWLVSPVVGVRF